MRPSHHEALDRWLAAERGDRYDEADAALREMFEALPLLAPPAGFANRGTFLIDRAGLIVFSEEVGPGESRDQQAWQEAIADLKS